MKLEDQVCSLELAKKLKELGVKQESAFIWAEKAVDEFMGNVYPSSEYSIHLREDYKSLSEEELEEVAAFTVAELGEMLKLRIPAPIEGSWYAASPKDQPVKRLGKLTETTEADARAKMLIYLIENKIITV